MEKLTDNSEKSLSSQKTFVKTTRHNPDKAYIRVHLKELYQLRIDKSNIRPSQPMINVNLIFSKKTEIFLPICPNRQKQIIWMIGEENFEQKLSEMLINIL